MFDDPRNVNASFIHLFDIGGDEPGTEKVPPAKSSLFNIDTLKLLIETGNASPNIIIKTKIPFAAAV